MYDQVTGFDKDTLIKNLDSFCNAFEQARNLFSFNFCGFFNGLKDTWCSPKAVEFNEYLYNIVDAERDLYGKCVIILKNAVSAFNAVANSHGVSPIAFEDIYQHSHYLIDDYSRSAGPKLVDQRDGIVGMNVMLVKLYLEEFVSFTQEYEKMIDNFPMELSLYDPENLQKEAYIKVLTEVKQTAMENIDAAVKVLREAIETESQTILLVKSQAVDILQNPTIK